jgi:hypothetical protein
MALHGTIEIGDDLIGVYTIGRREAITVDEDEYTYDWTVKINDQEIHGECLHRYSDGAIVLIGKVMKEAGYEHVAMGGAGLLRRIRLLQSLGLELSGGMG